MRFLANENFPAPSIAILRSLNYDVRSVREDMAASSDPRVIEVARTDQRIILTFDKDYGELIFKQNLTDPPAVVFFRYRGTDPQAAAKLLIGLLDRKVEIINSFTVVEEDGLRQRRYQ